MNTNERTLAEIFDKLGYRKVTAQYLWLRSLLIAAWLLVIAIGLGKLFGIEHHVFTPLYLAVGLASRLDRYGVAGFPTAIFASPFLLDRVWSDQSPCDSILWTCCIIGTLVMLAYRRRSWTNLSRMICTASSSDTDSPLSLRFLSTE